MCIGYAASICCCCELFLSVNNNIPCMPAGPLLFTLRFLRFPVKRVFPQCEGLRVEDVMVLCYYVKPFVTNCVKMGCTNKLALPFHVG